jgi:hypothetical protein
MKELKDMVGELIVAHIPVIDRTKFQQVKLLAVENGGIWIENQKTTSDFLSGIGVEMSPKTMIFFLPFAQINFIAASLDTPSISDKAIR